MFMMFYSLPICIIGTYYKLNDLIILNINLRPASSAAPAGCCKIGNDTLVFCTRDKPERT